MNDYKMAFFKNPTMARSNHHEKLAEVQFVESSR